MEARGLDRSHFAFTTEVRHVAPLSSLIVVTRWPQRRRAPDALLLTSRAEAAKKLTSSALRLLALAMPPATLFGFFLRANGIGEKDASAEWHGKTNSSVVKAKARAWVELLLKTGDVSSSSEQAWRPRSPAAAWRRAEAASCATRSPNGSSGRVRARGRARDAVAYRIGGRVRGGGDDVRGEDARRVSLPRWKSMYSRSNTINTVYTVTNKH